MPCFKGIAVSIHATGAPLPELGIQKQSRVSRINSYIPVPAPQLSTESGKPEPAKFAISITLLTPGLAIPYSTPKPTEENPHPRPQLVGELPSSTADAQGRFGGGGVVAPYIPMTNSENETIAAYIYFDGRAKEEVATLLRPGEETWVNSRWVQVPEAEGGGLAEREFLFREVGLERWLNGLDLEGHNTAAKLEKRRQRFEKRRRRQELAQQKSRNGNGHGIGNGEGSSSSNSNGGARFGRSSHNGLRDTLRYGAADAGAPVELLDDDLLSDDDDDDSGSSDDELPEAAGQIKVSMFRVLASGEIKKGEYSPQFDAHDDDDAEGSAQGSGGGGGGVEADVEHTTSFAKPKTLDPKTISTQTVTGIDGPEKPYATFTFFYRGERQLQKMGLLPSAKNAQQSTTQNKRRSQLDFSNIGPLKTAGTVGFSAFRDGAEAGRPKKAQHKKNGSLAANGMDEDSDEDDDDDDEKTAKLLGKLDDTDDKDIKTSDRLGPDDAKFSGELADGVNRIRLKRQHSMESAHPTSAATSFRNSPNAGPFGSELTPGEGAALTPLAGGAATATNISATGSVAGSVPSTGGVSASEASALGLSSSATTSLFGRSLPDETVVGSPLKKHRASIVEGSDSDPRLFRTSGAFPPALGDILAKAEAAQKHKDEAQATAATVTPTVKEEEDEEL